MRRVTKTIVAVLLMASVVGCGDAKTKTPAAGDVEKGDDYAATSISWEDAVKFCVELTKQDHLSGKLPADWEYRLPTETQWEYACRAGSKTAFSFGVNEKQLGEYAWYDASAYYVGEKYAHQVGGKRANVWGLHDLHGNVCEWCRDWYQKEFLGGTDPEVTTKAANRVYRGGGWVSDARFCRSAFRGRSEPDDRDFYLGFRVAAVQVSSK